MVETIFGQVGRARTRKTGDSEIRRGGGDEKKQGKRLVALGPSLLHLSRLIPTHGKKDVRTRISFSPL